MQIYFLDEMSVTILYPEQHNFMRAYVNSEEDRAKIPEQIKDENIIQQIFEAWGDQLTILPEPEVTAPPSIPGSGGEDNLTNDEVEFVRGLIDGAGGLE